jgi:hypothetical protein
MQAGSVNWGMIMTAHYSVLMVVIFYLISHKVIKGEEIEEKNSSFLSFISFGLGVLGLLIFFFFKLAFFLQCLGLILGYLGIKSSKVKWAHLGIVLSIIGIIFSGTYYAGFGKNKVDMPTIEKEKPSLLSEKKQEKELGYNIYFPQDWKYNKKDDGVSVEIASSSGKSVVEIQNLKTALRGGNYHSLNELTDDIKKSFLQEDSRAKFSPLENFSFKNIKGDLIIGMTFDVDFINKKGEKMKTRMIVLDNPYGEVLHAWSFTDINSQFNTNWTIAKMILDNWELL